MSQQRLRTCLGLAVIAGLLGAGAGTLTADTTGEPSLKLVQTIELVGKAGKLDHMVVDSKGQRLFLANKVNNTLDIVDLKAGKLLKQLPGQAGAQGVAYAADLDRIFVALGTGGFCNIFDGKDYKLAKTVKFKDDADNVRYNPRTKLVYVAHAEKGLGVIDAKTYDLKADIMLPGSAEAFELEKARPRLYLNTPSPSQVLVIDTDTNKIIKEYPLKLAGDNHAIAVDETNKRLYIGCRKKPMVVIMDSETGKEIAGIDIPGDIDDLFFDAKRKRLYASCGEGFLAVLRQVDAGKCELLTKIPTAKGARTCLFEPDSGKLYLAVPRQADKPGPEIRVYQARP
jgi:DNA-binding beta-propeller fold protein YncE